MGIFGKLSVWLAVVALLLMALALAWHYPMGLAYLFAFIAVSTASMTYASRRYLEQTTSPPSKEEENRQLVASLVAQLTAAGQVEHAETLTEIFLTRSSISENNPNIHLAQHLFLSACQDCSRPGFIQSTYKEDLNKLTSCEDIFRLPSPLL